MTPEPLFGWTVTGSMRGRPHVDDALDAVGTLDHLADARIERMERGPALADERAAADWLRLRSAEHAESVVNVRGFVVRRVPFVLVFAGSPTHDVQAQRVGELSEYLASTACLGFGVVEPRTRQTAWAMRIVGSATLGAIVATGVIAGVLDHGTAVEQDEGADHGRAPPKKKTETSEKEQTETVKTQTVEIVPDAHAPEVPTKVTDPEAAEETAALKQAASPVLAVDAAGSAALSASASASTLPNPPK